MSGELLWEPGAERVDRATMTRYMRWLEAERPELVGGYRHLYRSKYAPMAYREKVRRVIQNAKCKMQIGPSYEKTG